MNYFYDLYNIVKIQSDIPLNMEPISPLQECNYLSEPNLIIKVGNDLSLLQVCFDSIKKFSNVDRFYANPNKGVLYFKDVYYRKKYEILLANLEEKHHTFPTKIYATTPTTKRQHSVLKGNLHNLIAAIIQIKLINAGFLYIHGACLSKNNTGIVAAAHCGVGKSLLSFQAQKQGYNILSDDMTLIDSNGYGHFSYSTSTISYTDFIQYVNPEKIGWWKYHKLLIKSRIVEKNPSLMKFFPLPKFDLLNPNDKIIKKAKINTVCILEEGDRNIEEVDKLYLAKRIDEINEYSLEKFDRNRMLWMYAFFNEFDMNKVRIQENINLLKFLDGCKCYVLRCRNKNWMSLVEKL